MLTNRGDRGTHTRGSCVQKQQNGARLGPRIDCLFGSSCGPAINTNRHHQTEPQTSMSRETRKRKAKLNPERGDIHDRSSTPSRYHKSHVYSAAVRREEHLNTLVLKIHTAEGLFLFHSALTSSVQLDCFAFSTQPRRSERVHVLKCREMRK